MYNNIVFYPKDNSTIPSSISCLTITWYASCDFQLYALSPIVFLVLYKRPKLGVIWTLILLVISIFLPLFNRVVLGWPHIYEAISHTNYFDIMIGFTVHYWGPFNYFQTYLIGILIAYVVRRYPNVYFGGRIGELFIWIITSFMSFGLLYWQRKFMVPGYQYEALDGLELPLYLVYHKILYLSGFSWLLFACVTGRAGFINEILGWKWFKIIDNVTLEIYILHIFAFVYRIAVMRDQRTYSDYYVWTSATFDFIATYVMAVIVSLVVTRPFANMTLALLRPQQLEPDKKETC